MKLLAVHPSCLMYSKIYLRLEPLGLELVASAARGAGHDVRLIDLQAETHKDYFRWIRSWSPDAIVFSCNYLANVPEIIDLAKATRTLLPEALIMVGGHSSSFTASEILQHGDGSIDAVLKGEGEPVIVAVLEAVSQDRANLHQVPGVQTAAGDGPRPTFVHSLDTILPARDLLRHRRKYFIGVLDPCASIEFSRGCPWDCVFCSAWTFYGRSYRTKSPECAVEELSRIKESGVFLLDDVAFIQAEHGMRIGEMIAKRGIKKKYYLETRGEEARRINTRDYRLFDIQHAVLPTYLSLPEFYRELVETQRVLSIKHLGLSALREAAGLAVGRLLRGQTNFVRMLWKFNSVYNPKLQLADHQQPVQYEISPPPEWEERIARGELYVHAAGGRKASDIDNATEAFVEATRMGAEQA